MTVAEQAVSLVWTTTCHATALILVVFAVQTMLGRWLTPRWRSSLWLLVLARLLMPAAPQSPFSMFNLADLDGERPFTVTRGAPSEAASTTISPRDGDAHPSRVSADPPGDRVPMMLAALWIAGAAMHGAWAAMTNAMANRRLSRRARSVHDPAIRSLLEHCRRRVGVRRTVRLVTTAGRGGPIVVGWLHPIIVIPRRLLRLLSIDELRWVLLHELAHVRRHDLAINWLLIAAQSVHWFNPLVWWAVRRMRHDAESACDEQVLRCCRGGSHESATTASLRYANVIIRVLELSRRGPMPRMAVGMALRSESLERRITMLRRAAEGRWGWSWVGVVTAALVGCAGLTDADTHSPSPPAAIVLEPHAPRPGQIMMRMWVVELDQKLLDVLRSDPAMPLPPAPGEADATATMVKQITAEELATLEACLRREPAAKTVSSPRLILVSNEPAQVSIQDQTPYVVGYDAGEGGRSATPRVRILTTGLEVHTTAALAEDRQSVALSVDGRFSGVDSVITAQVRSANSDGAPMDRPVESPIIHVHAAEATWTVAPGASLVVTSPAPTVEVWPLGGTIPVKTTDSPASRLLMILTPQAMTASAP